MKEFETADRLRAELRAIGVNPDDARPAYPSAPAGAPPAPYGALLPMYGAPPPLWRTAWVPPASMVAARAVAAAPTLHAAGGYA